MILVSIQSEVVQDKRQFKTDRGAMRFLKAIHKLHMSHRELKGGLRRPVRKDFPYVRSGYIKYLNAERAWKSMPENQINLKVEIINTKHNQYYMLTQLKQA